MPKGTRAIVFTLRVACPFLRVPLAIGKERDRGSLTAGKLADIIVLAEDLYEVDVDHLPDIAVDSVYVGGRLVHDRLAAS